jgi:MoxR-like ATPase
MALPGEGLDKLEDMIVRAAESTAAHLRSAKAAIGGVIFGQERVVERALITVLSGGHALLVGVPGLAKTKLVETMGTVLGLDARRIQFTPDLMPSDILGSEVLEESPGAKRTFRFIRGPIFAQLLMADEINRASPRTQSALLQAMQEQHVTVAGVRHDLPKPFHVLATQNPLEQEGTYPLPEAQLDRFVMRVAMGYPSKADEAIILERQVRSHPIEAVEPVLTGAEVLELRAVLREIHVSDAVKEYIVELVDVTRKHPSLSLGASPRASLDLLHTAQVLAGIHGRDHVLPDDVKELAPSVLSHRLIIRPEARLRQLTGEGIVQEIVNSVPIPVELAAA